MKIFVTGATGFIGRVFGELALASGHEILGLSRTADIRNSKLVTGSIEDPPWAAIERFRPDAALHLAWVVTPGVWMHSPLNPALARASARLLEGLAARGVGHLAGVGTCLEYSPSAAPLSEDAAIEAQPSPYVGAKLQTLGELQRIAASQGCSWNWFRPFYCYGEGEHPDRLTPWCMQRLAKGMPVEIKTPASRKDYIHVRDVAAAILFSFERRLTGIINVGSASAVANLDFAREIAHAVGADPALVTGASPPADDPFPVTIANVRKLRTEGWTPRLSREAGLRRCWELTRNALSSGMER